MKLTKTGVTMMTSGKMTDKKFTFQDLFEVQRSFQNMLLNKGIYERFKGEDTKAAPADDIKLVSYHIQQLISEIGEVLAADKRWKSHRNDKYDKQEKLNEIADCFIVLMNVAMFSDFNGDEIENAITSKIKENIKRLS